MGRDPPVQGCLISKREQTNLMEHPAFYLAALPHGMTQNLRMVLDLLSDLSGKED